MRAGAHQHNQLDGITSDERMLHVMRQRARARFSFLRACVSSGLGASSKQLAASRSEILRASP